MKQLRSTSSRSNLSVSKLGKLFGVAKSSFYQSLKTSQNADKVNQIMRKHGLKARSYKRKSHVKPSETFAQNTGNV